MSKPIYEIKVKLGDTEVILFSGTLEQAIPQLPKAFIDWLYSPENRKARLISEIKLIDEPNRTTAVDDSMLKAIEMDGVLSQSSQDQSMDIRISENNTSQSPANNLDSSELVRIIEDNQMNKSIGGESANKEIQILVRKQALDRVWTHAKEDVRRETGGVLLGIFVQRDDRLYVLVIGIVRALRAVRSSASVNFTEQTWVDIWRKIDQDPEYFDDKKWAMVGWYHTHPGFGIFLSAMDLNIHENHFIRPGHIALVVDPRKNEDIQNRGYFLWNKRHTQVVRCHFSQVHEISDEEMLNWLKGTTGWSSNNLPSPEIYSIKIRNDESNEAKSVDRTTNKYQLGQIVQEKSTDSMNSHSHTESGKNKESQDNT